MLLLTYSRIIADFVPLQLIIGQKSSSDELLKLVALLLALHLLNPAVTTMALALDNAVVQLKEGWVLQLADFDSRGNEVLGPRILNNCRV